MFALLAGRPETSVAQGRSGLPSRRRGRRAAGVFGSARFWNFRTLTQKSPSVSHLFSRAVSAMGSSPAYQSAR